jgi:hypothetical protein
MENYHNLNNSMIHLHPVQVQSQVQSQVQIQATNINHYNYLTTHSTDVINVLNMDITESNVN